MRHFSRKALFLPAFLLTSLTLFALNGWLVHSLKGTPVKELRLSGGWHQVKRQLAGKTEGPHLFLLGGSYTHFGWSARVLEEELGIPSINYGTHAGLGHFHFERIKQVAEPGDVILLTMEFVHFSVRTTQLTYLNILCSDTEYYDQMGWVEWTELVLSLNTESLSMLLDNARKPPEELDWGAPPGHVSWKNINAWGDQTGNDVPVKADKRLIRKLVNPPDEILHTASFKSFFNWARRNDILVIATWPHFLEREQYLKPQCLEFAGKIRSFYEEHGIPLVGEYRDMPLPKENFLNSYYHLTHPAAVEQTKRLAPLLKPYLKDVPRAHPSR